MTDIEILMKDHCTKSEAMEHLRRGSVVFDDFEQHFDGYMQEWDIDEEEQLEYKKMIENKVPKPDWGIVQDGEKTYYIMYVLQ